MDFENIKSKLLFEHGRFNKISFSDNYCYKGLYGISIDSPENLKKYFKLPEHQKIINHMLKHPSNKNLLYIGSAKKAKSNISERLYDYQLGRLLIEKDPTEFRAVFYRKLGSVLGFVAAEKQKNFRFSFDNDLLIRNWILEHLRVLHFNLDDDVNKILDYEKKLIRELKPTFNYRHNPEKCKEVTELHRINSSSQ